MAKYFLQNGTVAATHCNTNTLPPEALKQIHHTAMRTEKTAAKAQAPIAAKKHEEVVQSEPNTPSKPDSTLETGILTPEGDVVKNGTIETTVAEHVNTSDDAHNDEASASDEAPHHAKPSKRKHRR